MTMPSGRYYVGDLCYVMDDDEWDECVSLFFPNSGNDQVEGEFALKDGRRFANFGTAWGDGVYNSNVGTQHSVDSGSIGCIRVEDIRGETYATMERLGSVVDFTAPFEVSRHGGTLVFGHVRIETDEVYDDDQDLRDELEDIVEMAKRLPPHTD